MVIAIMQDMASEERKAADDKIKEENLFKALGAGEQQAETDAFQCSRCKQVWLDLSLSVRYELTLSYSAKMSVQASADQEC